MDKYDVIAVGVVLIIASLFIWAGYEITTASKDNRRLCASNFGENYSFLKDELVYRHDYIDREHYNCCWDETHLGDDGYYIAEKCVGFENE